jgi:hypothetical protein
VGGSRRGEFVKSLPEAGDPSEVTGCLEKVYEDQREVLWAGSGVLKMSAPGGGTKVVVALWCLSLNCAGCEYSSSLRWNR